MNMMQFTETTPPLHHHHHQQQHLICPSHPPAYNDNSYPTTLMTTATSKAQLHHSPSSWPGGGAFPTSSSKTIATSSFGDATCMEQLLVHCANAIETNDATLAQQLLWVLNNIALPDGDSNHRLTSAFLHALISRAAKNGTCKLMLSAMMPNVLRGHTTSDSVVTSHKFSVTELASFVDITPWHRFGFSAANAAIVDALSDGCYSVVHVVDLSLTHCMQIPTLIDAISTRLENPPLLKLTVAGPTEDVPPMLDLSYEELGSKLVNFARSRNVVMEFRVLPSTSSDGFASLIDQLRVQLPYSNSGEALVINCHMMLHYVNNEANNNNDFSNNCARNLFIKSLRSLDPTLVILVDEDADFTSNKLVCRLRSAFNYLWIPYDAVDTFLPRGSKQRQWYEADICWKIDNVIAHEGAQRTERLEPKGRWVQRMRSANFRGIGFGEDAIGEVKSMLDEHSAGWGLKKEDEDIVLTWKGHNVVFASAWVPS